MWFERAAQAQIYRWNKFQSSLERIFGSLGADWEIRMVKEFGNSTDDYSEGGLGRCEDADPSNAPGKDAEDSGSDSSDDEEYPEEDPEEETDGTKTHSRV